ncbi:MAG: hypothetical protein HY547_10210 [Elusimicrobia bacterium]|nr:hypothetical protein [Elusimicrobiota bacterium]
MLDLFKRYDQTPGGVNVKASDIKARLDQGEKIKFLDVREDWERDTAKIEGSAWIPLAELEERYQEISPNEEIIIYCHGGVRSLKAVRFLETKGYKNLKSLSGGIEAWSLEADPSVSRY